MYSEQEKSFQHKRFLYAMIILVCTILIDTAVVKIYDIVDKDFIPIQTKIVLFSINSSLCLFLQFYIIRYLQRSFKVGHLKRPLEIKSFYPTALVSLIVSGALIGYMIFQVSYFGYYITSLTISIIVLGYGTATAFIIRLALLFFSWYRSNHNLVVFLYLVSMSVIAFNLVTTAAFASAKVNDKPYQVKIYVGGGGDISGGKHVLLDNIFRVSSFMSFFSIWVTTAILMNSYREKLVNALVYWVILSVPLVYFLITYFYQLILIRTLITYIEIDPVTVSIVLSAFLSLSRPIGGLIFGVAFWNISKIVSYERNIKAYMIISGWGILLIFAANQGITQLVTPYPPFGLATITVLTTASYLMLIGIYNSATFVSANNELRRTIHKRALESKLLGAIGHAEMEREIQKTVKQVTRDTDKLENELRKPVELDELELEKYIEFVAKEVRKASKR
jgi:hypothetical protein